MRFAMLLRLKVWSSVDTQTGLWFGLLLGIFTSLSFVPLMFIFKTDPISGLKPVDSALCIVFPGKTCIRVINSTSDDAAKVSFLLQNCIWGVGNECLRDAFTRHGITSEEATKLWRASCDGGDGSSCTTLGTAYHRGLEVTENLVEGLSLYQRGCNFGDQLGCFHYERLFFKSIDAIPSTAQQYRLACLRGGYSLTCYNLGFLHENGLILNKNLTDATRFYNISCNEGYPKACNKLGIMFEEGRGTKANASRATIFYEKGCDLRFWESCTRFKSITQK